MSIYAYTGLPGSGKSYSVVEHQVLPALAASRRVATNVPLKWDVLRQEFPDAELVEFPAEKVAADPASLYEYVTPGTVLILDEVWRLFPAGEKANKVPEPFRKLLAEHRHMVDAKGQSCQIVLVTQDLAQIGRFARLLVEQTFRTVKLSSVGMSKQFRVDVYNGPAEGANPPENRRIRQIFGHYKPEVYRYYETHTLKDSAAAGKVNEKAVDARANVLKRPIILIGALAVPLMIGWGLWRLSTFINPAPEEPPVAAATAEPAAAAPAASGQRLALAAPVSSGVTVPVRGVAEVVYRIAAVVQLLDAPERSRVVITDGKHNWTIPYKPACYSTPDLRTFCDYKGQEVGQMEAAQYTAPPEALARLERARADLARRDAPSYPSEVVTVGASSYEPPARSERRSRIDEWRSQ